MITDKVLDLNAYEMRYFHLMCKERAKKTSGVSKIKINPNWPSFKNPGNYLNIK